MIGRWLLVALAFGLAAMVALTVLFSLGSVWVGEALRETVPDDPVLDFFSGIWGVVLFAETVAPALTALPGLLLVVLGELISIRSWIYYVLGGGAALALIPLLAAPDAGAPPAADYMTIFASAGFAAGFVYWLLAGRRANN